MARGTQTDAAAEFYCDQKNIDFARRCVGYHAADTEKAEQVRAQFRDDPERFILSVLGAGFLVGYCRGQKAAKESEVIPCET